MLHAQHFFSSRWPWLIGTAAIASTLVACGGGGGTAADGTLKLAMTDSPGCGYDHVWVTVTKIRVNQSATALDSDSGWREITVPVPQKIDLLSLTNGALQELGSLPLPAGRYEQVRLVLSSAPLANSLVLTGTNNEIELRTPSGQQSGYKLQAHFDVTGSQVADMVLDFDACRSVVRAGNSGNYNLKPVVAVTKRLTTQIEGFVDPTLASSVVVSTRDPDNQLRATVPDSTGRFVIAYLPENPQYTVVVSGTGRTTTAITDVPVSTALGSTQLNTASAPIAPSTSATAQVAGTVTNAATTPLTEASVYAQQTLSTLQTLDVAWGNVDPNTAQYNLTLPLTAPMRASYAGNGGPLNFSADSVTPGLYQVRGTALGYTTQTTDPNVTLGAANSTTSKDLVLAP
ncbi:MAG: DUF4382 domain-containing protein [Limnohabitans sp.]